MDWTLVIDPTPWPALQISFQFLRCLNLRCLYQRVSFEGFFVRGADRVLGLILAFLMLGIKKLAFTPVNSGV